MTTPQPTSPDEPNFTDALAEGQKLAGCYVLRRRVTIAERAVWLAHDEVLGKDVSLHFVPSPIRGDARAMEELRQEVKRNRQLIHPNILRVHDLIEEPEWAAVTMDSFEGNSLAEIRSGLPDARFSTDSMRPWLVQLCQTLDDAHKIHLVHGDLSPANILVDQSGRLFLANFGISRCIEAARERLTGSPNPRLGALSPQQLDASASTRADDVYGLGAVLYELLTGRLPIAGDDLVARIRTQVPERVSASVAPAGIPAGWDESIAACLEKDPALRPASAGEIVSRTSSHEAKEASQVSVSPSAVALVPAARTDEARAKKPIDILLEKAAESARSQAVSPSIAAAAFPPPVRKAAAQKREEKSELDVYPSLYPRRSGVPVVGLAASVALIVVGLAGYYFSGPGPQVQIRDAADIITERAADSEITSVNNRIEPPQSVRVEVSPDPTVVQAENVPQRAIPETELLAAAEKPAAVPVAAAAAPEPTAATRAAAEKAAAFEKMKRAAEDGEKAHAEMLKQQQIAEASVMEAQKAIELKSKELAPLKKAADDLLKQRKLKEDAQKAAEAEAQKAQQVAMEKIKLAEDAKKSFSDLELQNKEKLAAQQRSEFEVQAMLKTLADKQRAAAEAAKAAAVSDAARQQQLATAKQAEQEAAQARMVVEQLMAAETALKAREEAERLRVEKAKEREKLSKEIAEMKKLFDDKMKVLEQAQREMEAAEAKSKDTEAAVKKTEEDAKKAGAKMPILEKPSLPVKLPLPDNPPVPEKPAIMEKPLVVEEIVSPDKVAAPELTLAMKTEPKPTLHQAQPAPADAPFVNSLGMKFAPVGDTHFSVWQTRVKDFEVFAKSVNLKSTTWKGPGFKQGPEHPVVNVTWQEAVAFCKWLTEKERKEGILQAAQYYRLPGDLEWSAAVGLSDERGDSPEARDMGVSDVYPWGSQWPPPPGSGNYTGEETGSDVAIKGYDDGFAWTSPVGSFPPNKLGLYDMGGNVWQWCMDPWNTETKDKVLRGASWYNGALKLSLLSSCRVHAAPDNSTDNYGFRIVLVRGADPLKSGKK